MPGRHLLEDPVAETEPESEALLIAFLSLVLILVAALLIGRLLHRLHVMWLSEAGAALLLGLAIGLLVRAAGAGDTYLDKLTFNPDLFMYILLPVIMFDAGYSLDPKPFVRNIGSISAFAFLGTTMSTFIVGYLMYAFGEAGWCVQIGANYNLLFGAIISATDPVTVLAIFSQLGSNTDLYINVFGESVLNDAVAMVIYETLQKFVHDPVTVGNVFLGIATFFVIFIGSVVFGVGLGFLAAVMFKTRWFLDYHNPLTESGVVVCTAFLSYLAPQAFHFSGIVSVLFCSIVMRLYVRPNLSTITQHHVEGLFKVLAGLFELFLFVYIGLTLFLTDETAKVAIYFAFVLLTLAVSRACNIFPLSAVVNWFRLPQRRIPGKQQFMMWWSGLRGAMAFALAIDAKNKYGDVGLLMQTCTFYIVFVTVLVNGGSAGLLLNRLNLLEPSHPPIEEGEDTMNSTGNEIVEFAACGPNGKEEDHQASAGVIKGANGDATGHVRVAAAASPAAVDIELGSGGPAHTRMDRWREFVSVDLDAKMSRVARVLSQRLVNPPQLTADPSTRGAAATAAEPPHAVVSQEMNGQVSVRGPSRRQGNSGATGPNQ